MAYINATLEEHPDIAIVATSEDATLEDAVAETLLDEVINPVSPLSVLGWLIGLPF